MTHFVLYEDSGAWFPSKFDIRHEQWVPFQWGRKKKKKSRNRMFRENLRYVLIFIFFWSKCGFLLMITNGDYSHQGKFQILFWPSRDFLCFVWSWVDWIYPSLKLGGAMAPKTSLMNWSQSWKEKRTTREHTPVYTKMPDGDGLSFSLMLLSLSILIWCWL